MKHLILTSVLLAAAGLSAAEVNLALNKTATATTVERKGLEAAYAVDGKTGTRWSSVFKDNQMLTVDLGKVQTVGQVRIIWEGAAGKTYKIQLSKDGKTWTDAAVENNGKGRTAIYKFKPQEARFVRMNGEKRLTKYGFSILEFQVFAK